MGKSAPTLVVVREVAQRFASGVCWIELATLSADSSADETVPAAIALGIGLRPSRHDTLAELVEALASFEVLIALDNAEHVQAPVARVVEAVLQSAPHARFLVTSQIPLNAKGGSIDLDRFPRNRSALSRSGRRCKMRSVPNPHQDWRKRRAPDGSRRVQQLQFATQRGLPCH